MIAPSVEGANAWNLSGSPPSDFAPDIAPRDRRSRRHLVYIARNSFRSADRIVDELRRQALNLTHFPLMGPGREELAPGLRSWTVPPHIIFYRKIEDTLVVVRILHGKRDITSDLF